MSTTTKKTTKTKAPKKSVKKPRQQFLSDGEGGSMEPPRIRAIEDAADLYQDANKKRVTKTIELKEQELVRYDELDTVLLANADALGPNRTYTYTDANDKRKTIRYGKPRITIKAAKAEKKPKIPKATTVNSINPDAGESLPSLE